MHNLVDSCTQMVGPVVILGLQGHFLWLYALLAPPILIVKTLIRLDAQRVAQFPQGCGISIDKVQGCGYGPWFRSS